MLFKEPVTLSTLKIIQQLFNITELNDFNLVGGTALALQIGHRISVDIDLFCKNAFDNFVKNKQITFRKLKAFLIKESEDYLKHIIL